MATPNLDLWPADFGEPPVTTPVSILRQQGVALGKRTQNFILGKVVSRSMDAKNFFHGFSLYAPFLGFERQVISVTHALDHFYPVRIEVDPTVSRIVDPRGEVLEAMNEEEFVSKLGEVLQSERMKSMIRALLAQSQGRSTLSDSVA